MHLQTLFSLGSLVYVCKWGGGLTVPNLAGGLKMNFYLTYKHRACTLLLPHGESLLYVQDWLLRLQMSSSKQEVVTEM